MTRHVINRMPKSSLAINSSYRGEDVKKNGMTNGTTIARYSCKSKKIMKIRCKFQTDSTFHPSIVDQLDNSNTIY